MTRSPFHRRPAAICALETLSDVSNRRGADIPSLAALKNVRVWNLWSCGTGLKASLVVVGQNAEAARAVMFVFGTPMTPRLMANVSGLSWQGLRPQDSHQSCALLSTHSGSRFAGSGMGAPEESLSGEHIGNPALLMPSRITGSS